MRLFQRLRQRLGGLRYSDQVHMIRHQAVPQQGETVKLGIVLQQLKVSDAIGIAGEDNLPRVSPLRNMMSNVGDYDTRQSSHR